MSEAEQTPPSAEFSGEIPDKLMLLLGLEHRKVAVHAVLKGKKLSLIGHVDADASDTPWSMAQRVLDLCQATTAPHDGKFRAIVYHGGRPKSADFVLDETASASTGSKEESLQSLVTFLVSKLVQVSESTIMRQGDTISQLSRAQDKTREEYEAALRTRYDAERQARVDEAEAKSKSELLGLLQQGMEIFKMGKAVDLDDSLKGKLVGTLSNAQVALLDKIEPQWRSIELSELAKNAALLFELAPTLTPHQKSLLGLG